MPLNGELLKIGFRKKCVEPVRFRDVCAPEWGERLKMLDFEFTSAFEGAVDAKLISINFCGLMWSYGQPSSLNWAFAHYWRSENGEIRNSL